MQRWSGHNSRLVQRINRRLALGHQVVLPAKDGTMFRRTFEGKIIETDVNVRELAAELGFGPLVKGGWRPVKSPE